MRDYLPLIPFVLPSVLIGYGLVLPRHGLLDVPEITIGFASTIVGAVITYVVGLRTALARRGLCAVPRGRRRRPEWLARQAARPVGVIGRCLGLIMARETRRANRLSVTWADLSPDARVLDLGCGPGGGVAETLLRVPRGHVTGIDRSAAMVQQARRRNRAAVQGGRASIVHASAERVPLPDASIDRIIATHVVYFWTDLAPVLRECRRLLRPGGTVTFTFGDPHAMRTAFPASVYRLRTEAEFCDALSAEGWTVVGRQTQGTGAAAIHGVTVGLSVAGCRPTAGEATR